MSQHILMRIMSFMTGFYLKCENSGTKSGSNNPIISFIFLSAIISLLFLASCSEKYTDIGIKLLPPSDFEHLRAVDTFTVESFTNYPDSVPTNNKSYSYLGGLYNPYFGNVSSDFVAQLRLTQRWPSGGFNVVVDSVKLYLSISGARGKFGIVQKISLYEIDEKLYQDTAYYSTQNPRIKQFIGTFPLPEIKKDSAQTLEVSLPISFGEYLLRDTSRLFQASSGEDFRDFFKGVYVTVSEGEAYPDKGEINGGPLLLIFNFSSTATQVPFYITIFYHTYAASNLAFSFIINDKSVRYNRYYHDFSTAEPDKAIRHINDGVKDTLTYLQSFYGVYTKIRIPGLASFRDSSSISVNRARLTVPVYLDGTIYKADTIPSPVYLIYKTSEGRSYIVPDYYMSSDFYNGKFSATTGKFTFNIAAFVQNYIRGNIPEPELIMSLGDNEYRNIIFKANKSSMPVKFELIYSHY